VKYEALIGPYARVKMGYYATPPCLDNTCESQDLDALAKAVAFVGPISVAVNAQVWRLYQGGVLSFTGCGNITMSDLDHAVQLVGFNRHAQKPYWIVRNTWSTHWGQSGYIYLEYGKNTCGIANLATYPELYTYEEAEAYKSWYNTSSSGGFPRRLGESRQARFDRLYKQATSEGVEIV
jgi:C1A family cysteine protease